MGRESLVKTLMMINEVTEEEAKADIAEARAELMEEIANGEMPFDFCADRWGLEPDYLDDLIF